jgi:hypothetical protein
MQRRFCSIGSRAGKLIATPPEKCPIMTFHEKFVHQKHSDMCIVEREAKSHRTQTTERGGMATASMAFTSVGLSSSTKCLKCQFSWGFSWRVLTVAPCICCVNLYVCMYMVIILGVFEYFLSLHHFVSIFLSLLFSSWFLAASDTLI